MLPFLLECAATLLTGNILSNENRGERGRVPPRRVSWRQVNRNRLAKKNSCARQNSAWTPPARAKSTRRRGEVIRGSGCQGAGQCSGSPTCLSVRKGLRGRVGAEEFDARARSSRPGGKDDPIGSATAAGLVHLWMLGEEVPVSLWPERVDLVAMTAASSWGAALGTSEQRPVPDRGNQSRGSGVLEVTRPKGCFSCFIF